jgi:tRNA (uracil-5-)-methyltransferase TRM9
MKNDIVRQLLLLNDGFYSNQADSFSATRQRIQPGMARSIAEWVEDHGGFSLSSGLHLLDLGCGNGNLAAWLDAQGYQGAYTGIDQSQGLLAQSGSLPGNYAFLYADLSKPDWLVEIPTTPYDLITCFAVLHHLPGEGLRLRLLRELKRLMAPEGKFIFSVWQFHNSARLMKRVQPWDLAGLDAGDVDAGDALLDWRAAGETSGAALRYVHAFTQDELQNLAARSGFQIIESWLSDGSEGCLGLYQIWSRS